MRGHVRCMSVCMYKNPSIPANCASSGASLIAVPWLRMCNDKPSQNEGWRHQNSVHIACPGSHFLSSVMKAPENQKARWKPTDIIRSIDGYSSG